MVRLGKPIPLFNANPFFLTALAPANRPTIPAKIKPNTKTRAVFFLLFFLSGGFIFTAASDAASHYIRQGATGAQNGSNWTDAWTSLPVALIRGDTYYIADGSYGSYTFDDAKMGELFITIKKAIASEHGTDTGWQSGYGDGQAVFNSITFHSGNWVFDGQSGGGPTDWENNLGVKVTSTLDNRDYDLGYIDYDADNVTLAHLELDIGASGSSSARGMELVHMNNLTIRYCYIHDIGCDIFSMDYMNDFTLEYSKIARNYQSSTCHGDIIEYQSGNANHFVIRYNLFEDVVGSYGFGSHGPTIDGYEIYGNVFHFKQPECSFGNGLVATLSAGGTLNNVKFYNNTLSGYMNGNLGFYIPRGSGIEVYNNIWHRLAGSDECANLAGAHDNNSIYNFDEVTSGEENLSGDPFMGSSLGNFALQAKTDLSRILAAPYNMDLLGHTRGADGAWDRGAYESVEPGSAIAPASPKGLSVK